MICITNFFSTNLYRLLCHRIARDFQNFISFPKCGCIDYRHFFPKYFFDVGKFDVSALGVQKGKMGNIEDLLMKHFFGGKSSILDENLSLGVSTEKYNILVSFNLMMNSKFYYLSFLIDSTKAADFDYFNSKIQVYYTS